MKGAHMRGFLGLCLAAALELTMAPAQAQDARWTEPEGTFSLDTASQGWRVADRAVNPEWFWDEVVVLVYSELQDGAPRNLCRVSLDNRMATPAPVERARINEITRQLEQSDTIQEMRTHDVFRFERAEVVEIDGVAVLDVYGQFMSLDTIQRRFFMYRDGEIVMYTLACSVEAANADAVTRAHAIAASLRFAEAPR